MKIIFQRARHIGYLNFITNLQQYHSMLGNIGLWEFKVRYGLVLLPWWIKPEGTPITDPRRLLTDGKPAYFVGWDIASTPSVQVIRTWARPTAAFPMGSYKVEIDGKLVTAMGEFAQEGVPGSPYWHGGPPFAMWSGGSWPWKDEEVDDGIHE